ncbi:hypothetical protein ACS78V_08810 [Yersinia enterocolitica]|uniref:hypothetical protein n=1 Tax=Yersinia enterocolitica TaxID=630 RepID=UPI0003D7BA63|nr:hypothetical protein [Yersinia enterocolitica]CCQ41521.1 putative phage tail protein [Yersinia enterocolitica (type O:5) str. YE53/03]CNG71263.1 putative phage tail protein [Yersinia enterocolitica]
MSWYEAGTVTSVAGTNVITGTGTLWNNPIFGIASGQMIFIPGSGQVVIYEILSVDSDTKIRVTKNIASAITNSEYAIVTTVSNSMSDLARRTAVQLALYQKLLEDWQDITTGTGDVTIIAPDGSTVVIPALSWISDSKTWFDANKELIENAGEAVAGAETARDEAVAAKTAAQSAEAAAEGSATSASGSATIASGAAAAATDSASTASGAATIATQSKDGAVSARNEAEQFAASVNPDLLMHTTGGTFTGPVNLSGAAMSALQPSTFSQLTGLLGRSVNLVVSIPTSLATATLTADEVVVQTEIGGLQYKLNGLNKNINLATTGAGGMDTGTAPAIGFVGLYLIYNPSTRESALLAVNATIAKIGEIYNGNNMPSGYSASALVSVLPISASKFSVCYQHGRHVSTALINIAVVSPGITGVVTQSIATAAPRNAKDLDLYCVIVQTVAGAGLEMYVKASSSGIAQTTVNATLGNSTGAMTQSVTMPVITEQTIYYNMANTASGNYTIASRGYSF